MSPLFPHYLGSVTATRFSDSQTRQAAPTLEPWFAVIPLSRDTFFPGPFLPGEKRISQVAPLQSDFP